MTPLFQLPDMAEIAEQRLPDGGCIRTLLLPHPQPRANLLLLSGRADFLEKWADVFAELHAAGFAITSFDWRGQGGSSRMTRNGAGHIDSFDHWLADLDGLAQWAATALAPGPWVALGHSMGGHLLLRWLADPQRPRQAFGGKLAGAILASPLFGIHGVPGIHVMMRLAARLQVRRGQAADYAWTQTPYGPQQRASRRQRLLTASIERFQDEGRWLQQQPDLATGGVSWGWLDGFARSMELLLAAPLEDLTLPVLVLLAEKERVVDNRATRRVLARLPRADLQLIESAAHEILRESDPVRARALQCITRFVQEVVRDA